MKSPVDLPRMSGLQGKMFIDGQWVGNSESPGYRVRNPADGEVVGEYYLGDESNVKAALAAAHRAFPLWSRTSASERGLLLKRIAGLVRERKEHLAGILTCENGKPIVESRAEVESAAQHFEWFAEETRRNYGRVIPPPSPSKRNMVLHQPIGVVGVISPWNFPFVLWARKVAPALAAGCTVVARAASQTTLVVVEGTRCCEDAGLPRGVVNLVTGPAQVVSDVFLGSPLCRKLSFTGSTRVGRELITKSAPQIKKLSLELGGHAPAIVFEDCDLEIALEGVLWSKFRNNGQSCIATNRIYIQESIHDEFVAAFVDKVKALRVGHGLFEESQLGAIVDESSLDRLEEHVQDALEMGAKLETGGSRLTGPDFDPGFFFAPTVLTGIEDQMRCMVEETFGPVAPIASFRTEEEVIERANGTRYGLAAYLFTRDLGQALRVGEALEAGTVGLNDPVPSTVVAPFGGFKESGIGRECGSEGLEAFLETKHISIAL